jgi:DtxR family transcriptional regulator, Mn-dependent transcriptional regulator
MTHMAHRLSAPAEDCLKAIYYLSEATGRATVGALAERLGVTPASVSAMLRRLAESRDIDALAGSDVGSRPSGPDEPSEGSDGPYVILAPYRGVTLTAQGREVAIEMVRRHRLLELFLVRELDVPPDRAHVEAECLEHDLSEGLEEHIAAKLGHPTRGIHGQPIPRHDGTFPIVSDVPLSVLAAGTSALVVAIPPYEPELVAYLTTIALVPGTVVTSDGPVPFSDSILVRVADVAYPIGTSIAQRILVQCAEDASGGSGPTAQ